MQAINIVTVVDVIGALSTGTLRNNIFMIDNGAGSEGQGTALLQTACYPGQLVNWSVHAIDVQTPVLIRAIELLHPASRSGENGPGFSPQPGVGGEPEWHYWRGLVPWGMPAGRYQYRLTLQMAKGRISTMYADTPALHVGEPTWSAAGAGAASEGPRS
jgi:hypothetical protein